jgi:integrase
MNRHVNLTKRIRTPNGLRFCPVVVSANGRLKPDYVFISGRQERHTEGAYYLEWYGGGRRVRRSVGKNAGTAAVRRHQQEQILASKAAGIRAKLNADHFYLHKFRATFATWALWSGVDLRTVQQWMGHSDLESTLRYLKPNRGAAVRDKINTMFKDWE